MKICMLLARFRPFCGGTELQAERLARALRESGDEAFVLTARVGELPATVCIDGVPVSRAWAPGRGMLSSGAFAISALATLLLRRREWDLVHAHLASSHALAALVAGRALRRAVVVKLGGARATVDIGTSLSRPGGRLKLACIARGASAVVAPSSEVLEEAAAAGFPRTTLRVIPNGVDTAAFAPSDAPARSELRRRFGIPGERPVGACVGRLERGKGLEALLTSWSTACPAGTLLVAGEGSLRRELESHHASERVRFLGHLPDVRPVLGAADLFLLPSAGEGLSNALLEAMACGIVPVVSPITANLEIVTHERTGYVVDFAHPEAAPGGLSAVLAARDRWAELGAAARDSVVHRFAMPLVLAAWRGLYAELLAERHPSQQR